MDPLTWALVILLFFAVVSFFMGSPPPASNEHAYPVSDDMINQVLTMFPDLDRSAVRRDLQSTGSVQVTVENALAGKIRRSAPTSARPNPTLSTKPTSELWEAMLRNPTLRIKRLALVRSFREAFLEKENLVPPKVTSSSSRTKVE